jgi:hypothetical protein
MLIGAASALRPRLELFAKAFLVTSFVGVIVAAVLRVEEHAAAARRHCVDLGRWTVLDRPAWATLDDVRGIRAASGLATSRASWFDPSLEGLDRRLARSPSVLRVADVRRAWPNRVEAVLELRRPVAAVRIASRSEAYVEVDEDGVALSRCLAARPVRDGRPLRVVTGAVGPAVLPGRRFGADVRAAASLAAELDRCPDASGRDAIAWLDRIDVANWGGRARAGAAEVSLSSTAAAAGTASACVVEWGRAGLRDEPGREMPFDAKARHLFRALRLFPGLQGLKAVRVAFDDLVVVPDATPPAHLQRALEEDTRSSSR